MKQNILVFQYLLEWISEIDMKSLIYILQDNKTIFENDGMVIWFIVRSVCNVCVISHSGCFISDGE